MSIAYPDRFLDEMPVLDSVTPDTIICVASGPDYLSFRVAVSVLFYSPEFTGEPTAPTPDPLDNSTRLATTEFVQGLLAGFTGGSGGGEMVIGGTIGNTPVEGNTLVVGPGGVLAQTETLVVSSDNHIVVGGVDYTDVYFGSESANAVLHVKGLAIPGITSSLAVYDVFSINAGWNSNVEGNRRSYVNFFTTGYGGDNVAISLRDTGSGANVVMPGSLSVANLTMTGMNLGEASWSVTTEGDIWGLAMTYTGGVGSLMVRYMSGGNIDNRAGFYSTTGYEWVAYADKNKNFQIGHDLGIFGALGPHGGTRLAVNSGPFDLSQSDWFTRILDGTNSIFSIINSKTYQTFTIEFIQDSTGGRTVNWVPSIPSVTWLTPGGVAAPIALGVLQTTVVSFKKTPTGYIGWITGSQAASGLLSSNRTFIKSGVPTLGETTPPYFLDRVYACDGAFAACGTPPSGSPAVITLQTSTDGTVWNTLSTLGFVVGSYSSSNALTTMLSANIFLRVQFTAVNGLANVSVTLNLKA